MSGRDLEDETGQASPCLHGIKQPRGISATDYGTGVFNIGPSDEDSLEAVQPGR